MPKKSIAHPVKNSWESKKPVKKVLKTPKKEASTEIVPARPVGRPTIYWPHILEKAREYLKGSEDIEGRRVKTDGAQSTSYEYYTKVKIPTIEGLAIYLNITKETLYDWARSEDKKEFSDFVKVMLSEQANRLIEKWLSGEYNPSIVKLLLSKHGYRETTEVEQTSVSVVWVVWLPDEKQKALESLIASRMKK
jgi:hypothetical protein